MMPVNFADHIDNTAFKAGIAVILRNVDVDTAHKALQEMVETAAPAFLLAKAAAGELTAMTAAVGYRINFVSLWNRLAADHGRNDLSDAFYWSEFKHLFSAILCNKLLGAWKREKDPDTFAQSILDYFTAGTFGRRDYSIFWCRHYSFRTGESYSVCFDSWSGYLMAQTIEKTEDGRQTIRDTRLEPLADSTHVAEVEITYRTGNLLICDWFHLEPFTQFADDKGRFDINCEMGREAQTKWLAGKGIISFSVGNTSPQIHLIGDALAFGRSDLEMPDLPSQIGEVDTHLWAVTIVEEERLLDILKEQLDDQSQAEAELQAYFAKTRDEFTRVNVAPGTYRLSFCGDTPCFGERYRMQGLDPNGALNEIVDLFGVLAPIDTAHIERDVA